MTKAPSPGKGEQERLTRIVQLTASLADCKAMLTSRHCEMDLVRGLDHLETMDSRDTRNISSQSSKQQEDPVSEKGLHAQEDGF